MNLKIFGSLILISVVVMPRPMFGEDKIKSPNVSGQFYSADPRRLAAEIDTYFARSPLALSSKFIRIVVVPHAGYVYSGWVAAYGFKAVSKGAYSTIVVLAPSHFFGFDGVSVWTQGAFRTPLGDIPVDENFARALTGYSEKFSFEPRAFEREHSLEVELPFLQKTFHNFKIVPVIMGQPDLATINQFSKALHEVIGERKDVLIVVSTDLSHYHDDTTARIMDSRTLDAVREIQPERLWKENKIGSMEMCGLVPTVCALMLAQKRGIPSGELLRYANSGDITGDKNNVVGYSSVVFYEEDTQSPETIASAQAAVQPAPSGNDLSPEQKRRLLTIAKDTIHMFVTRRVKLQVENTDPRLNWDEGVFVTITKHGQLRGCMGNTLGDGPLYLLTREMAITASSRDPRFNPVTVEELADIKVEVSVLSKPRPVKSPDEIVLGVHGVILSQGPFHQGLFLPQVATEHHMTREQFFSELCSQKAGLPRDCWKDPKTQFQVFTAQVFSEDDLP